MNFGVQLAGVNKIEIVEHPSAKRIVMAFFRKEHPRMDEKGLLASLTEFTVVTNKHKGIEKQCASVAEIVSAVRKIGLWGYCNHITAKHKEIHYWVGKKASASDVVELFAHELAHAGGYGSEMSAMKIAGIGSFAYQIMEANFMCNKKYPGVGRLVTVKKSTLHK